ncbi:hypothetical protein ITJ43_10740 [Microbacterium sp. VKM Ac-2870]|uniref:hypothetical protein n=1 Tax=Microbacterium sp. VKM Ac-2870 TaxID=2783825 RepID=UPI001889ED5B|nr:hypothetical protein [Microbacterium sp. VKM Ac-2870]MBF4562618.1 hypothetical protein [Microbacterium sp. VKM Ac-2870]
MFTDAQVQQAFASLETMLSDPFIYKGNIASDLTPVPDFTATGVPEQCIPVLGAVTLAVAADARKDIRITGVSTGRYDGQISVSYRTAARTLASTDDATTTQQALVDAAGDASCTTAAATATKQGLTRRGNQPTVVVLSAPVPERCHEGRPVLGREGVESPESSNTDERITRGASEPRFSPGADLKARVNNDGPATHPGAPRAMLSRRFMTCFPQLMASGA